MAQSRAGSRLESLVSKRLEENENIVSWCRVWYSRPVRWRWAAARFRDYVVITDRRLMMYSAGVFSRLPRSRVLADRLDDIMVVPRDSPRRLHISLTGHPPLLFEFDNDANSLAIAEALLNYRDRTVAQDSIGDNSWPS